MKPCRECQHTVSEQAQACPQCGAPFPARASWDGWGYEYKSKLTIAGFAIAQFAAAWSLIAQIGVYVAEGRGQLVISVAELLEKL